jgi:hypothetical protein
VIDFLDFINVLGIVALSIWLVVRLRRWSRSDGGRERLLTWSPTAFIPAQAAIGMIWLLAIGTSPWSFYFLYQSLGGWSILPIRLLIAAILIVVPSAVIVCDGAWLRLHRMPVAWTLPRVWATSLLILLAIVAMVDTIETGPLMTAFLVLAVADLLTTLFLTVWWFFSHPVTVEKGDRTQ